MAIIAVFMPLGDASLALQAGAPSGVAARHLLVGAFLLLTFWFLRRLQKSQELSH
jgi:hypothetical protein